MAVNLRFTEPRKTTHPVDLRFGAPLIDLPSVSVSLVCALPAPTMTATVARPRAATLAATLNPPHLDALVYAARNAALAASMAPPTFDGILSRGRSASLAVSLDAPLFIATGHYDNAVFRGIDQRAAAQWQCGQPAVCVAAERFQAPRALPVFDTTVWQIGKQAASANAMLWQTGLSANTENQTSWQGGVAVGNASTVTFSALDASALASAAAWQDAAALRAHAWSNWFDRLRMPRPALVAIWGLGQPLPLARQSGFNKALPMPINRRSRWQVATQPKFGAAVVINPGTPPCYTPPRADSVMLRFSALMDSSTVLIFTCCKSTIPPAATTVVIPVRRAYLVINDVSLWRVDGNYELPLKSLSLSIDMDSWTWAFNASLTAKALPMLERSASGEPVMLRAVINGQEYLLIAETVKRDRSFGSGGIQVAGRGQSAVLDAPSSKVKMFQSSEMRTAQQLMNDALTINGVSLGWEIDWRIQDWTVPAGAWLHQGTYMSAVKAVAMAAGAFVQPHPVNRVLRVRPRIPSAPWATAPVPDIELPHAAITKESIEWQDKPEYNAVYVSGTTADGILGFVKRAGTAGDAPAQMITDPLITHVDAARQRGLSVLADSGRMAMYSLSMQVLPETGVIEPGTTVRYVDQGQAVQGVVRSVSVSAALPQLRQTIGVAVHV